MNDDLLGMAYPYALDVLDVDERRALTTALEAANEATREGFADEVRRIRETFAVVSEVGAVAPPAQLRARLLEQIDRSPAPASLAEHRTRRRRWQMFAAAAAVAGVLAGGGVIVRQVTDTSSSPGTAEEVIAASDMHKVTSDVPGGGSATAMYSKAKNAVVLVMKDVTPPSSDTVYQMWLVSDAGSMVPAGTMTPADVRPETTVVLDAIGTMTKLAFTVEPPGGSPQPTSAPFAVLQLS